MLFKRQIILTFVVASIVGGISVKGISMVVSTKTIASQVKDSKINSFKQEDVDRLNSLASKKRIVSPNINSNKENQTSKIKKTTEKMTKKVSRSKSTKSNSSDSTTTSILVEKQETTKKTTTRIKLQDKNSNSKIEDQDKKVLENKKTTIHYDRTTSIYADDEVTLLRVEYYLNNKLLYYSVVEKYDVSTKSYMEKIYMCNRETNNDPLIRTDVYENGKLIKTF